MRFETHQTVRKGLQVAVLITGGRRLYWQPLREGPPAPQNSASGAPRSSSTGHRWAVRGGPLVEGSIGETILLRKIFRVPAGRPDFGSELCLPHRRLQLT
jgi:hypothetical protein